MPSPWAKSKKGQQNGNQPAAAKPNNSSAPLFELSVEFGYAVGQHGTVFIESIRKREPDSEVFKFEWLTQPLNKHKFIEAHLNDTKNDLSSERCTKGWLPMLLVGESRTE